MLMRSELSNPFLSRRQQAVIEGDCPNGGQWYACGAQQGGFVGCCTVNPCTSVGCAAGNIRAAGLGNIPYGSVPDQACRAEGQFFTCTGPPSFWGCCKSVPCGTGCPQADLAPASLVNSADNPFVDPSQSTSPPSSGGGGTPTGAIVGGVVGGVLGLALIGVLIWWLLRRNKNKKEAAPSAPMAYSHNPQPEPGPNVPLTYPEVVDHYATTSPAPQKQHFPPSAYTSPALPQYSDNRRESYELGGNHGMISPSQGSPGFPGQGRPMSYELHGSQQSPNMSAMQTPSIMSAAVSELPAEDMRYSQVSSNMRYSGQPPISPVPEGNSHPGSPGLGLTMPGQTNERTEK